MSQTKHKSSSSAQKGPQTPQQARRDWQRYGTGTSQKKEEDLRRPKTGGDLVVKIIAASARNDINGAQFTAYLVSISSPESQGEPVIVEHRYSEFAKLHAQLRKNDIIVDAGFPSKHWAGRVGSWTPSLRLAPSQHEDLITYRKMQLDLWLLKVIELYNRGEVSQSIRRDIEQFLCTTTIHPCDRENELDLNPALERGLRWLNPLSFTLGSAIRQATATIEQMCNGGLFTESDKSIPLDLIQNAKGLCFLTVFKAGMVFSGKIGTGLVIAKKRDDIQNSWSAPSAIGTIGVGWGAQIGGDICHYLIVLNNKNALDTLCHNASVTLGAEMGIAAGPIGRSANSHISTASVLQPAYAYAHSHGLFVGMSFEGSVLKSRHDVNANFYGRTTEVRQILEQQSQPKAGKPMYDALRKALKQQVPEEGIRPSQMLDTICSGRTTTIPIRDYGSMTADSFAEIDNKQSEAESSVFSDLKSPDAYLIRK